MRAFHRFSALLMVACCMAAGGCDLPSTWRSWLGCSSLNDPEESTLLAANESADREMDELHANLGQHESQFPRLNPGQESPPPETAAPMTLDDTASRTRMREAVRLAEAGQLHEASQQLAGVMPAPSAEAAWLKLRAELLALRFHQEDVAPLAARFAAFARLRDAKSGVNAIRDDLRRQAAWAWRYVQPHEALLVPTASGSQLPLYLVQSYENRDVPKDLAGSSRPFQHFHFVVLLANRESRVSSYVVQSRELMGTGRVFFLERQQSGRTPEVLQVYDSAPSVESASTDVLTFIARDKR